MTAFAINHNRAKQGQYSSHFVCRQSPAEIPSPLSRQASRTPQPVLQVTDALRAQAKHIVVKAGCNLCTCRDLLAFHRRCRSQLRSGISPLELDLTEVEHADTKLIACLVDLQRTACDCSAQMEIKSSPVVRRWASLCHLEHHLLRPSGSRD